MNHADYDDSEYIDEDDCEDDDPDEDLECGMGLNERCLCLQKVRVCIDNPDGHL